MGTHGTMLSNGAVLFLKSCNIVETPVCCIKLIRSQFKFSYLRKFPMLSESVIRSHDKPSTC